MAAIATAPVSASVDVFESRVARILNSAMNPVLSWNRKRKTRNVLARLSDHELDDIGLTRGDIDTMAFSLARGR